MEVSQLEITDGEDTRNLLHIPRHTGQVLTTIKASDYGTIMPLAFGYSYLKMGGNFTWASRSVNVDTCINISISSDGCRTSVAQAILEYERQGAGG